MKTLPTKAYLGAIDKAEASKGRYQDPAKKKDGAVKETELHAVAQPIAVGKVQAFLAGRPSQKISASEEKAAETMLGNTAPFMRANAAADGPKGDNISKQGIQKLAATDGKPDTLSQKDINRFNANA